MTSNLNNRNRTLAELQAAADLRPVFPFYHVVGPPGIEHIRRLYDYKDADQFEADVEFFARHFQPVGLGDVIASVSGGRALPDNAVLISFDDGLREVAETAVPILEKKGVPAAAFLCPAFLDNRSMFYRFKACLLTERARGELTAPDAADLAELWAAAGLDFSGPESFLQVAYRDAELLDRAAEVLGLDFDDYLRRRQPYMTSADVAALIDRGFGVGSHSIDHPRYAGLPLDEQVRQTAAGADMIQQEFRLPYRAFAFPYSDKGVGRDFFARICGEGNIDVSFGTSGVVDDEAPGHFQRLFLDPPDKPAAQAVPQAYAGYLQRRRNGKGCITRDHAAHV